MGLPGMRLRPTEDEMGLTRAATPAHSRGYDGKTSDGCSLFIYPVIPGWNSVLPDDWLLLPKVAEMFPDPRP